MTPEEKMLATALRDLCGWHVGMVDEHGRVRCNTCTRPVDHDTALPALDSPANWGHWLSWCWGRELVVDVEPAEDEPVFTVTLGCSDGPKYSAHGTFASALLQALCKEADMGVQSFPPSVLAWWKEHGQ